MKNPNQILAPAFAIQAIMGIAWWSTLFCWPGSRSWFLPEGWPDLALLAFVLGDAVLFVAASLAISIGLWNQSKSTPRLIAVHAGAVWFATSWCLIVSACTSEAWLSALLMTGSSLLSAIAFRSQT